MGCEVQKDVRFEDIAEGDVIVMEVFNADNTAFIGDYRGTATHMTRHHDNREGWFYMWNFDGMHGLRSDSKANYRLFRVEPPSAAETELDRLRKIESGLRGYVDRHTDLAKTLRGVAVEARSNKNYLGAENLTNQADDIMYRMRRLEAILNGK
jgi:hypothetical protein